MIKGEIKRHLEKNDIRINDNELEIVLIKYKELCDMYNKIINRSFGGMHYINYRNYYIIFYIALLYKEDRLYLLSFIPFFLVNKKNNSFKSLYEALKDIYHHNYKKNNMHMVLIDSINFENKIISLYNGINKEVIMYFYKTIDNLENQFSEFTFPFNVLIEFLDSLFTYIIFNNKIDEVDKIYELLGNINNNSMFFFEKITLNDIDRNVYDYFDYYFSLDNRILKK